MSVQACPQLIFSTMVYFNNTNNIHVYVKITAVHITALTLNFILFSKHLAVSWSFFQLPQNKNACISAHVVGIHFLS